MAILIWVYLPYLDLYNKLIIPIVVLAILAILSLTQILYKVAILKDHPHERAQLEAEIERSK